jgi:hypothetical protein
MNSNQKVAVNLLDILIDPQSSIGKGTQLLCCPDKSPVYSGLRDLPLFEGWAFWVEDCFLPALDITRQTRTDNKQQFSVWTQGSAFSFKEGAILYRPDGASMIQITDARAAIPAKSNEERDPGYVLVQCYKCVHKPKLWEHIDTLPMTQDEFVRLLIADFLP